ncbi:MAG: asparagine synthase (glutamine-hydrolyzing) [Thermodesulfobacteriota bacterium]
MCGISGFVGTLYSKEQLQKYINAACKQLEHRGPDQTQVFIGNEIVLGISRLAIRDPQNGKQPMSRNGYTIVFNGELYNTRLLKEKLMQAGYYFQTECDTEILLSALVEFGDSIIGELEGMFAFALWDEKNQLLTLARDRWGEKPLYYTCYDKSLTFASEIKALSCFPNINWDISKEDVLVFLKNSYLPHPRTGWHNIHKLEQGTFLRFQKGQVSVRRFFTPILQEPSDSSTPQTLFELLHINVKNCLISDKPVGGFLSGGLDSSTISYFLSRENPNAPIFSLHWDDESYSEQQYTSEVAKALKLNHFSVTCDSLFFMNHFDSIVDLYDEPFGDESMVPTYCLAKFAKEKVDVVLTGDGADEFFHGYERYFFEGSFENYLETFAATPSSVMELVCHPDFIQGGSLFPMASFTLNTERVRSWVDMNTYLTDDILMKVDRASMGVGLEARCPFLTPQITNFALQCSMDALVGNRRRGKEILREAMKNHLPQSILERKKMGFGVPLNEWFRTILRDWMLSKLLSGELLKSGWFSESGIRKLVSLHDMRHGNYARPLLNLLVLERWLKRWNLIPLLENISQDENINYWI